MKQAKNAQRALVLAAIAMLVGSSFVACGQFGKRKVNGIKLQDRHETTSQKGGPGDGSDIGSVDDFVAEPEKPGSTMVTVQTKIEVVGVQPVFEKLSIAESGTSGVKIQKDFSGGQSTAFDFFGTLHTDIDVRCVNSSRLESAMGISVVGACPVVAVIVEATGGGTFEAVDQKINLYERQADGSLVALLDEPVAGEIDGAFFAISMYDGGNSEETLINKAIDAYLAQ